MAPDGDPAHLVYLLINGTAMFSHGAEVDLMTNSRSKEPGALGAHVEMLLGLLLPGVSPPEV